MKSEALTKLRCLDISYRNPSLLKPSGDPFDGLTLRVDAGYNKMAGDASTGYIMLLGQNSVQFAGHRRITLLETVAEAELHAMAEGILGAVASKFTYFRVYSDCAEAVALMNHHKQHPIYKTTLVERIMKGMEEGLVRALNYIPRTQNTLAHTLARKSLLSSTSRDWWGEDIPDWIAQMALSAM